MWIGMQGATPWFGPDMAVLFAKAADRSSPPPLHLRLPTVQHGHNRFLQRIFGRPLMHPLQQRLAAGGSRGLPQSQNARRLP